MFIFTKDLEQDDCNNKELFQGREDLFSLPDSGKVVQSTSSLHLSSPGKWDYTFDWI